MCPMISCGGAMHSFKFHHPNVSWNGHEKTTPYSAPDKSAKGKGKGKGKKGKGKGKGKDKDKPAPKASPAAPPGEPKAEDPH